MKDVNTCVREDHNVNARAKDFGPPKQVLYGLKSFNFYLTKVYVRLWPKRQVLMNWISKHVSNGQSHPLFMLTLSMIYK